jgi:dienelactone hydrolase
MKNSKEMAGASRLFACTAGILFGLAPLLAGPAAAADAAEVGMVIDAVRGKYPDLAVYCRLSDAERRQVVVGTTMALASSRKMSDPFAAGPEAGAKLRQECGIEASQMSMAQLRWLANAPPLKFNTARASLGVLTSPQDLANRVFAPDGPGPFPVVVIGQTKSVSAHLLVHARSLIDAGFAVLVVDTFGSRDYKIGVNEPFPSQFAKDAYDALGVLQALDYVDRTRIYQTGYSNGGLAAALLASPEGARELKAAGRFRATVANYGSCKIASPYAGGKANVTFMEMLSADSDRPLLMLMGELDIETPPATCFPLLNEMKAAGKPVEWHVYPKTTHGWDKAEHNGHVFRTNAGETMAYRYDAEVTRDATARMIGFFNRHR